MGDKSIRPFRTFARNRIDLVYWDSGGGIRQDALILERSLRQEGYQVGRLITKNRSNKRERILKYGVQLWKLFFPTRLQIHLEQIHREQFRFALANILIPNPEFTDPKAIPKVAPHSIICCKTQQAKDLLSPHAGTVRNLGFTSRDMYLDGAAKDYRKFLHLAGRSQLKGTMEILEAWKAHPEWPELTLVWTPDDAWGNPRRRLEGAANIHLIQERVSEEALIEMINSHGVHLCPSRTEGFGHYIVEALSAASIVVTTDAPPMNELVNPEYGYLVEAAAGKKHFMNTLYHVKVSALEDCIPAILKGPHDELVRKGQRARSWFLENDKQFKKRLIREVAETF